MEYDREKVDEVILALMQLTLHEQDRVARAWKAFDWDSLDRLHEKEYIANPKTKAKSVVLTEKGLERSAELFDAYFGVGV